MQNRERLMKHASLVDRMADSQGVDLEEAALRGQLSVDDISDAVLSCTGCTSPEACEGWLNAQQGKADDIPSYCRNSSLFARLAKQSG